MPSCRRWSSALAHSYGGKTVKVSVVGRALVASVALTSIVAGAASAAEPSVRPLASTFTVKVKLETGAVLAQNLGTSTGAFAMEPLSLPARRAWCSSGENLFSTSSMGDLDLQVTLSREAVGDTIKIESDGKTVALGKFTKSSLSKPIGPINDGMYNKLWNTCTLLGSVARVPKRDFYTVYVNDDKVGDYTYAELKKGLSLSYS